MNKSTEQLQREFFLRQAGPKTSHGMHAILSVLTGGFWLIFWGIAALSNKRERDRLVRNDNKQTV